MVMRRLPHLLRAVFGPLLLAATLLLGVLMPVPAQAQLTLDEKPYDPQLLRLVEILGAIHYLRELCGAGEGQLWREQMKVLLQNEGTTAIRRAKLVKTFNKGYRGYRRTYRACNETALIAIERFMEEGSELSALIVKEN